MQEATHPDTKVNMECKLKQRKAITALKMSVKSSTTLTQFNVSVNMYEISSRVCVCVCTCVL